MAGHITNNRLHLVNIGENIKQHLDCFNKHAYNFLNMFLVSYDFYKCPIMYVIPTFTI